MSAIYGAIDLTGKKFDKASIHSLSLAFDREYSNSRIDRYECVEIENGFMSCGIQYFNSYSRQELLPIYDRKNNILFTADCLLDNRDSLISELTSDYKSAMSSASDGTLIYESYLKWGEDFANHLRGLFSLVIYDISANTVLLYADQFVSRSLFYHIRDGVLYFSTLLKPLISATGLSFFPNERWLTDSISVRGPIMMTEEIECAYADVYKLNSGHFVKVSPMDNQASIQASTDMQATTYIQATRNTYYNPTKHITVNTSISDAKASELIHTALSNSVRNCISTDGQVAIMLSSGLDSTTIAGFASPMLKASGKKLYAYTSVPEASFSISNDDSYFINDESSQVRAFCKHFDNIELETISSPGKSILTEADRLLDIWELPCKSQQNAVWTDEIMNKAREAGCRIVLSGAIGNTTISAGDIHGLLYDELRHFRLIGFYRDFSSYFNKYHGMKRDYLKRFFKNIFDYKIGRHFSQNNDFYRYLATKHEIGDKHNLEGRLKGKLVDLLPYNDFKQLHSQIYLTLSYSQIGEVDTKNSLRYGVIERDPCKNVEVIETLLTFPMKIFVNGEFDRRIIRDFMSDIVPDEIRLDIAHRGRQSADNYERIRQVLASYIDEIKTSIYSEKATTILDRDKLDLLFGELNKENAHSWQGDYLLLMDLYMFSKYLNSL